MTYVPRDLSISLRAVANPQHVLNGGPKGATFPGWFLTVQQNEGYDTILAPVQLAPAQVETIAAVIDRVAGTQVDAADLSELLASMLSDGPKVRTVQAAVQRCSKAMDDELLRQLEAARSAAARIPALEAALTARGTKC